MDLGEIELKKMLDKVQYGEMQLFVKLHNSQIAELQIPYSKSIKGTYTTLTAYIVDQFRKAQFDGFTGVKSFTVTFNKGEPKRLVDTGQVSKRYKIKT